MSLSDELSQLEDDHERGLLSDLAFSDARAKLIEAADQADVESHDRPRTESADDIFAVISAVIRLNRQQRASFYTGRWESAWSFRGVPNPKRKGKLLWTLAVGLALIAFAYWVDLPVFNIAAFVLIGIGALLLLSAISARRTTYYDR